MDTYWTVRKYADGVTRAGHVSTDSLAAYVASERDALLFPTTVVQAVPCTDPLTCTHGIGPVVHLHTPVSGAVCGVVVNDRARDLTPYRSETTCRACLATLTSVVVA